VSGSILVPVFPRFHIVFLTEIDDFLIPTTISLVGFSVEDLEFL
jgi:hypothetical protein